MQKRRLVGLALAAGSGVLYGSINVLVKPLDLHPFTAAATAYLVSAAALSPFLPGLRIRRADWSKVLAMGLLGGGLAPVLLFYGLQQTRAADAGLLLTAEMVGTAALAMMFLKESFRRIEWLGLALLLAAAACVALASRSGNGETTYVGIALVLGSAVAWAVDNTVSARLVGDYRPRSLIAIKGLIGGSATLAAALVVGAPLGSKHDMAAITGLGLISIAVSSLLFYNALRRVGAARTSALNVATTALVGAFGGVVLLSEHLHWLHGVGLACVAAGAWILSKHGSDRDAGAVAAGPS